MYIQYAIIYTMLTIPIDYYRSVPFLLCCFLFRLPGRNKTNRKAPSSVTFNSIRYVDVGKQRVLRRLSISVV
jgi:hypothetical protein